MLRSQDADCFPATLMYIIFHVVIREKKFCFDRCLKGVLRERWPDVLILWFLNRIYFVHCHQLNKLSGHLVDRQYNEEAKKSFATKLGFYVHWADLWLSSWLICRWADGIPSFVDQHSQFPFWNQSLTKWFPSSIACLCSVPPSKVPFRNCDTFEGFLRARLYSPIHRIIAQKAISTSHCIMNGMQVPWASQAL